jgi:MYXO-CTERM domain-containing protein
VSRFDEKTGLQCCSSPSGVTTDADRMCFATQTTSYVAMEIQLATTAATPELAQYLFKVGIPVLNQNGAYGPFGSLPLVYNLQNAANEYCFNLEAMDIASGQSFGYADLMPHCQLHGNLGTIGTQPIVIDFDAVLARAVCPTPPASYVTQWCAINAACSGTPSQAGCEQFGQLCRGEPPPSAGTTAGRGVAGSGGTIKSGSAGVPGMAGGSTAPGVSAAAGSGAAISGAGASANGPSGAALDAGATHFTHAKACSATAGTAGSASGWSGYLAVALLFARRRRRFALQHTGSVTSSS